MLAQNFKTPADLGITDAEFEALARVLGMLERGELRHAKPHARVPNGFNMDKITNVSECGTVLCIAGWARHLNGGVEFPYHMTRAQNDAMEDLIMPPGDWKQYTPQVAAIALRNYLSRGEPRWAEALAA